MEGLLPPWRIRLLKNIYKNKKPTNPPYNLSRIHIETSYKKISLHPVYKPVSQSCAVAKSDKFWGAVKSILADRMEDCSIGQSAVCVVTKTKLWNLFFEASRLYAKFDCPVAPEFSLLATSARDCETGLTRKFAPLQVRKNRCMNSFTQIAKIHHSHVCISLPFE